MRQLLSNLASQSNVHGISSLAGDKSAPLKFFWGLAFLGLLAFAVFQLYTIGTIYYSFPVKTKVKMEFKPLPFPAITICNMNTIRRSKIYDVQSHTLQQMLNVSLFSLYFKLLFVVSYMNISFFRNATYIAEILLLKVNTKHQSINDVVYTCIEWTIRIHK